MENLEARTKTELRRKLRHYYGKRMYRITADGDVHYYGNPANEYDRSHDYWHYLGHIKVINNATTRERGCVWRVR